MFWTCYLLIPGILLPLLLASVRGWNTSTSLSWENFFPTEGSFLFDELSAIFLLTVCLVSLVVFGYANFYILGVPQSRKFMAIFFLFFGSMLLLASSGNLFWIMVGWDGLGITSFFLIVFFQNWKSCNSGIYTLVCNRIGDAGLLLTLGWCLGMMNPWTELSSSIWPVGVGLLLLLGAISNSAQIPFSAWLPLAMAAPTPVSALVHSSTLITAGVYLTIRFWANLSDEVLYVLFVLSTLSAILAGVSALIEQDLNKIIAYSTLSHVSLMFLFISVGELNSAAIHIMMHAFFNSHLFMIAGCLIHASSGSQDVRKLVIWGLPSSLGLGFCVSVLSMIGIPFFSGFFSNELMVFSLSNLHLSAIFLISCFFTCAYSSRLLFSLFSNENAPCLPCHTEEESELFVSPAPMIPLSSLGGMFAMLILVVLPPIPTEWTWSVVLFLFSSMGVGVLTGWLGFFSSTPLLSGFEALASLFNFSNVPQPGYLLLSESILYNVGTKGLLEGVTGRVCSLVTPSLSMVRFWLFLAVNWVATLSLSVGAFSFLLFYL